MKIRYSFVANSSNTNFCIYGFWVDDSKIYDTCWDKMIQLSKYGINIYSNPYGYDNSIYVGKCITTMGEDETMRQFKVRTKHEVETALKELEIDIVASNIDFTIQQDGWRDG